MVRPRVPLHRRRPEAVRDPFDAHPSSDGGGGEPGVGFGTMPSTGTLRERCAAESRCLRRQTRTRPGTSECAKWSASRAACGERSRSTASAFAPPRRGALDVLSRLAHLEQTNRHAAVAVDKWDFQRADAVPGLPSRKFERWFKSSCADILFERRKRAAVASGGERDPLDDAEQNLFALGAVGG